MVVFRGGRWRHATHEAKKPSAKELFGGTVLNGYLEAAKARSLTEFAETQRPVMPIGITEIPLYLGNQLITWNWTNVVKPIHVVAKKFWIQHGAMRADTGRLQAIQRRGYANELSLRSSGIATDQDVWVRVVYPDNLTIEERFNMFDVVEGPKGISFGKPGEDNPQKLNIDKVWKLIRPHTFINQRTGDARLFDEKNITLLIQGQRDNQVTVRGRYPNDDYWATMPAEDLIDPNGNLDGYLEDKKVKEQWSMMSAEERLHKVDELNRMLHDFVESDPLRGQENFKKWLKANPKELAFYNIIHPSHANSGDPPETHTYYFLMDEGLPTEEKIKVTATNDLEAGIQARDEFTKRRGKYHTTSRMTSKHSNGAEERKAPLPWNPADYTPIEDKTLPSWPEGFYVMSYFDPEHAYRPDNYSRSPPFRTVAECVKRAEAFGIKQFWVYQYDKSGMFKGAASFLWNTLTDRWESTGVMPITPQETKGSVWQRPDYGKMKKGDLIRLRGRVGTLLSDAEYKVGVYRGYPSGLFYADVKWDDGRVENDFMVTLTALEWQPQHHSNSESLKGKTVTWESVGTIWTGIVTDDFDSWVKVKVVSPKRLDEPQSLSKKNIRTVEPHHSDSVHELPKVKVGAKTYYFDERLSQLRNVDNPHDFINLTEEEVSLYKMETMMSRVGLIPKEKRSNEMSSLRVLTTVEKHGTRIRHRTALTEGIIIGTAPPHGTIAPSGAFRVWIPLENREMGLPFERVWEWDVIGVEPEFRVPTETRGVAGMYERLSKERVADVEKWLRDMYEDENKAVNEYKMYANKMRELGFGDLANRFEGIASDEGRHASIVKEALEAVNLQRKRLEGLQ
jgi:hypothetical protein